MKTYKGLMEIYWVWSFIYEGSWVNWDDTVANSCPSPHSW